MRKPNNLRALCLGLLTGATITTMALPVVTRAFVPVTDYSAFSEMASHTYSLAQQYRQLMEIGNTAQQTLNNIGSIADVKAHARATLKGLANDFQSSFKRFAEPNTYMSLLNEDANGESTPGTITGPQGEQLQTRSANIGQTRAWVKEAMFVNPNSQDPVSDGHNVSHWRSNMAQKQAADAWAQATTVQSSMPDMQQSWNRLYSSQQASTSIRSDLQVLFAATMEQTKIEMLQTQLLAANVGAQASAYLASTPAMLLPTGSTRPNGEP